MGTGSSKGASKVLVAETSLNAVTNNDSKNKNAEFERPREGGNGNIVALPTKSDRLNIETGANLESSNLVQESATAMNGQNSETQDSKPPPSSSNPLLTSYQEKYPAIASTLSETYDYYQGLKGALESAYLNSEATLGQVKGLVNVYKKPIKNKSAFREFVVAIGVPKLAYDVIVDCREKHPELFTWDRGKAKEKENEDKEDEDDETEQGNVEEGNKKEEIAVAENNKTEQIVMKDRTKNEEIVEKVNEKEQAITEEVNKKEQVVLEEGSNTSVIPENQEHTAALKMAQDIISKLLAAVLNFSDLSDSFSLGCDEVGMVQLLVDMIKELQDSIPHHVKYVNAETQQLSKYTVRGRMMSSTMGIIHNLSKRIPTRRSFATCQALDVLIPLLKAEVVIFAAKSLLILAYLIDEENNHLIMADEGPIKFLTSLLKKSLKMVRHRYFGFSAAELAEGLTQIAVNDNNKKMIAQSGAIPILVTMLEKAKTDLERLNACNTLWTLAFDEDNRKEIKNNESAILELQKLLLTKNSELKKAAAGALWECQGKEKHAEEKQLSATVQEAADTKHVMISYQWDVQKSMIQLKTQLQAHGFKVWMDIDEMGGSTLESMARAVENAAVVLVGVSQKYKESPNCRSEAEYTYQLHKDIIPLMMDYKYKPDGWLGIIVGSKFWIDFSERHKLDTHVEKLVKELGNRGKMAVQETAQAPIVDVVDASPQISVRSWTNSDVVSWLKEVGLANRLDSKAVQRLDGRILLRLQDLRKESPEFFYSKITSEFKLVSLFDVLEFTDELDKLER